MAGTAGRLASAPRFTLLSCLDRRHFAVLADARHLMCERDFRQALAGCGDALCVWQLFAQWPLYRGLQALGQTAARPVSARMQQSNASP
ncbi:MAG: hypothetical protein Q8O29_03575 [Polaromonas sp.]|uniref:hypothetical protein n=1 Tax=Polaromonas sp. TaxID=1869339 RepID=UPI002735C1CB|nr:hypothetical protein [Polaromonas sp.]MDP2817357.1 hypothetical protein [Polaromonas sp.]